MSKETKEELKKEIEELEVTLNGYSDLNNLNLALIERLAKEKESLEYHILKQRNRISKLKSENSFYKTKIDEMAKALTNLANSL